MMRLPARTLAWLLLAAPAIGNAAPTLAVTPDSVEICGDRERLIHVALSDAKFDAPTSLTWYSDASVRLSAQAVGAAASSAAQWLLRVVPEGSAPRSGSVHLVAAPPAGANGVPVAATLKIRAADAGQAFPAKLEIQSAWDVVNERQTATLHVVLMNQSPSPLRVERIVLVDEGKPFKAKELVAEGKAAARDLPPWGVATRTFELSVAGDARPPAGKHRLLVQADLTGEIDGCPRNGSLIGSRDLAFAVLGESALLTALAIPSFLLMPGALFLLAPAVLWLLGLRLPGFVKGEKFPLGPGTSEFWTVAISLSIIGFGAASIWVKRDDLFVAYRFSDVVWAWFASLAIGSFCYLVWRWQCLKRDAQRMQREFVEGETASQLLARLVRRDAALKFPMLKVDLFALGKGTGEASLYLLELDLDHAWLCSKIEAMAPNPTATQQKLINDAIDSDKPQQLLEALASAGVEAGWGTKELWPTKVARTALQAANKQELGVLSLFEAL